jgi:hypothetical protein
MNAPVLTRPSCSTSCALLTRSLCLVYLFFNMMAMIPIGLGSWLHIVSRLRARYACITKYHSHHVFRALILLILLDLQRGMIKGMIDPRHKESLLIRPHRSVKRPFWRFRENLRKIICPFDMGASLVRSRIPRWTT